MRGLVVLAIVCVTLTGCVKPGQGASLGGRYVDRNTCEIRNKLPNDPPYDADCMEAARRAAEAATKASKKK